MSRAGSEYQRLLLTPFFFCLPESQVCFCNLRNLREENGPSQVQESTNNLCILADTKLAGVLRAICKYRHSIHKVDTLQSAQNTSN